MVSKILQASDIKIGDYLEIIDSGGGSAGNQGDRAIVRELKDSHNPRGMVVNAELITGKFIGDMSARYWWRYQKVDMEWD
jgi:hypothetical protein